MSTKIYILLPVHNRRAITEKFIDCLVAQLYTNYHLILIDDGSVDGTDVMVRAKIGCLTVIKGKGEWWWAGSLQQGIDWLKCNKVYDQDIVLFMNDDVEFESNFLQMAVQLLDAQDGLLLPQVFNNKTEQIEESGVCADLRKLSFITANSPEKINCLPTRGLFMRMANLLNVGDLYPKLLPHYLSDYEFTIRAYKKGLKLLTSPSLLISYDETTTGFREFNNLPMTIFLRSYFSIKSTANPLYWSTFVLLVSPKLYIPWHLFKIWLGAVKSIFKHASQLIGINK